MKAMAVGMVLALTGCTEHILLVGETDDPSCEWTVTEEEPAVITVADLERCVGDLDFIVIIP